MAICEDGTSDQLGAENQGMPFSERIKPAEYTPGEMMFEQALECQTKVQKVKKASTNQIPFQGKWTTLTSVEVHFPTQIHLECEYDAVDCLAIVMQQCLKAWKVFIIHEFMHKIAH